MLQLRAFNGIHMGFQGVSLMILPPLNLPASFRLITVNPLTIDFASSLVSLIFTFTVQITLEQSSA